MRKETKLRRRVEFNTGTRIHRPKKGPGSYIRKKKNNGNKT
mgnify:FL=1